MSIIDTPAALAFDRTISRDLVHRTALEEVFLTDFQSLPDGRFRAAGRLPRSHPYYTDQLHHPGLHDPLAVFESVRQSLLCATHLHHDAPSDTKAITARTVIEITDPTVLRQHEASYELELNGSVASEKWREGVLTRVVHEVEVVIDGRVLGTVMVDTALRPSEVYQELRMKERPTPPPWSDRLFDQEEASRLPAHLVGRGRAENVLLMAPTITGLRLDARMRLPFSHPSMFDHRQDHLPGTVMVEAARQAGLLLAGEAYGRSPAKTVLVAVDTSYQRFVELDAPVLVSAEYADPAAGFEQPITVEFVQNGAVVAVMRIRLAGTEAGPAEHEEAHRAL